MFKFDSHFNIQGNAATLTRLGWWKPRPHSAETLSHVLGTAADGTKATSTLGEICCQ